MYGIELDEVLHVPDFWWDPNEAGCQYKSRRLTDFSFPIVGGSVITWLWASSVISRKGANTSLPSAAATSTSSRSRFQPSDAYLYFRVEPGFGPC